MYFIFGLLIESYCLLQVCLGHLMLFVFIIIYNMWRYFKRSYQSQGN
uniref:Uncharacterized protein n=1 Tax=Arundo donax TaxID=35708 RepID=A0A0A9HMD0_ARUDO